MKNLKNSLFYIVIIGGFSSLMYWIIIHGKNLEIGKKIISISSGETHWNAFKTSMTHNLQHPLAILLAQIITAWCILAAVIAIVKAGSLTSSFYVILLAIGYVVIMLKVVRLNKQLLTIFNY